jgi:WD40 repeat protein
MGSLLPTHTSRLCSSRGDTRLMWTKGSVCLPLILQWLLDHHFIYGILSTSLRQYIQRRFVDRVYDGMGFIYHSNHALTIYTSTLTCHIFTFVDLHQFGAYPLNACHWSPHESYNLIATAGSNGNLDIIDSRVPASSTPAWSSPPGTHKGGIHDVKFSPIIPYWVASAGKSFVSIHQWGENVYFCSLLVYRRRQYHSDMGHSVFACSCQNWGT